jgi:hypothetical protein
LQFGLIIRRLKVRITCRITEEKYNCGFGGDISIIDIVKIKKSKKRR